MPSDCLCSGCGASLNDGEPADREACPNCGSRARTFGVAADIRIQSAVYLKTHTKHRDGGSKVLREVIEGDDYYRKTGKWSVMRRVIDRGKNWYEEIFRERETGAIIHEKAHPLSEHTHPPKNQTK